MVSIQLILFVLIAITLMADQSAAAVVNQNTEEEGSVTASSYGVDVSFPIFKRISTSYPHLPHNVDPSSVPTPKGRPSRSGIPAEGVHRPPRELQGVLRRTKAGNKCDVYEYDRMLMNQRQPQR